MIHFHLLSSSCKLTHTVNHYRPVIVQKSAVILYESNKAHGIQLFARYRRNIHCTCSKHNFISFINTKEAIVSISTTLLFHLPTFHLLFRIKGPLIYITEHLQGFSFISQYTESNQQLMLHDLLPANWLFLHKAL